MELLAVEKLLAPPPKVEPPVNLTEVIAVIDCLRLELGFLRWSHLKPWCSPGINPKDADADELEHLLERLCVRWADG